MSTWLLLATAFAQDCTPNPANLVAAPAPGASEVPPDISPVVMFPGDPCRTDLRMELIDQDQDLPTYVGDLTSNQLSPWGLASSGSYEARLYVGDEAEPFKSWTFTTSEDTWATPLEGPSYLNMDAWIEDLEDGTLEQVVLLNIEPADRNERVIMVESQGLLLWAGNPRHEDLKAETFEIRYQVGTKRTPYCVTLTDLDELGAANEQEVCVDQSPPAAALNSRCATGPLGGNDGLGWAMSLLRR